jgi:AsmA family protein
MPTMSPLPRWPKVLLLAVAATALLLGGAYLLLNRAFPPERLAALLSTQVREATGREFAVRGALSIRVLPGIAVVANDLSLGNARWGTRKDMLTVRQAQLNVALWPLLQGRVDIERVSLQGVDLLLESDAAGVGNWVMPDRDAAAPAPGAAPAASAAAPRLGDVAQVQLADAHVAYRNARGDSTVAVDLQKLAIERDGAGHRVDARFSIKGQAWQLTGPVGRLGSLADAQTDWPFDLQLSGDGARLSAKGQLLHGGPPRALAADIAARLDKAAALAPWIANATQVPLPVELKTKLSMAASKLQAEGLHLVVAEQSLNGRVSMTDSGAWKFDAQLASPSIDLARWLPKRAAASASAAAGSKRWLFDETPIPFDALPRATGVLALQVDRLRVPGLPELAAFNTRLTLRPGRLTVEPLSFGAAGGSVHGSLGLNVEAAAAPRSTLQFDAKDLSVDALMRAAGTAAYASGGRMQLHAALNMAGATPRALAAGASGEVMMSVTGTTLGSGLSPLGTDMLPRVLQALTLQPGTPKPTFVECAVVRLPLKNGVAMVDRSIALETDQLAVSAKGQIRLTDETLELAFRPNPKQGLKINPADLAKLVVLKGPLRDPKLMLDVKGAADLAVAIGAAGATGGWSTLADRLLHAPAEPQPCRFAATGQSTPGASAPAPADKATPPAKALQDLVRKIFK